MEFRCVTYRTDGQFAYRAQVGAAEGEQAMALEVVELKVELETGSVLGQWNGEGCVISFFSSRRRHTRYWRDWSSDVCSSDLVTTRRTFVLDTSVLLSDPGALLRFGGSDVVLPLVVIGELEDKRHHPELGWFARQALRMLDDLRVAHGRLDAPIPIGEDGGTLHVELNHSDPSVLPAGFRNDSNDSRIMVVALNLRADGRDVRLITKDVPLRVKAAAVGLDTDEYRMHDAVEVGWTGMAEVSLDDAELDELYTDGEAFVPAAAEMPPHTGLVLLSSRGSALGRVTPDKQVKLVRGDREAFGLHGRSAERSEERRVGKECRSRWSPYH